MGRSKWVMVLTVCVILASACGAVGKEEAQPPTGRPGAAAPSLDPTPQQTTPVQIAAHPALYPSERQLNAWLDAGRSAFATGVAYDDAFSVPGVSRWFWLPSQVVVIGDAGAVVGLSCETPQLLATHAAWRGTRSALPEAQVTDAVYAQLAQQAGYCRLVVVGLAKSPSEGLGLEYVLNVNGVRYGQPRISSPYDEPLSSSHSLLDRRDYNYLSVEVVERFDVEYKVDIQGKTYNRTEARSSVGYERRVSVSQREAGTVYTHLVTEIIDFPLLRDDGAPLIPADAEIITLEMLAPDASYEVNLNLRKDESYLRNEAPMVDFMRAVTMVGISAPPRGYLVFAPKSKLHQALEDIAKRPEYADWILEIHQIEPKVPTITISVQPGRSPYETKKALKALVLEGQKACEEGNLVVILEVRGRKLFEASYRPASKSVVVNPAP